MIYHEFNEHVDLYTASADVCMQKLSGWWQQGPKVVVLDLYWADL